MDFKSQAFVEYGTHRETDSSGQTIKPSYLLYYLRSTSLTLYGVLSLENLSREQTDSLQPSRDRPPRNQPMIRSINPAVSVPGMVIRVGTT